ncbi:MAG: hypothetical protein ACYDH3_10885 [Candidatus Aminicenantales bacterium]
MENNVIQVNRAPVLTLWAAVVAERLGYGPEAALSLGKALAGLNAQSKGRRLGIYKPVEAPEKAPVEKPKVEGFVPVELLGRLIQAGDFGEGLRAVEKNRPIGPEGVRRYLEEKFGEAFADVKKAMRELAASFSPRDLNAKGFSLYERFRPSIPDGVHGWGAKGSLDLKRIRSLAKKAD